jgi:hypothetical protein
MGLPVLTFASIALTGGGYVFFLLCPLTGQFWHFGPRLSIPPSFG